MKQKKKWGLRPTLFGVAVLMAVIFVGIYLWQKGDNPLLEQQNSITLYMEIQAGDTPVFQTERFFAGEDFDYSKVTYDTTGCDFDTPGVYMVPVLFDGEETNCVVQVTVKGEETESHTSDNTVISAGE